MFIILFSRVLQVGTSLGATRGLLLRGGNILEKFSMVDTIVFDKTGTLTIGRPVVTKVLTPRCANSMSLSLSLSNDVWTKVNFLVSGTHKKHEVYRVISTHNLLMLPLLRFEL